MPCRPRLHDQRGGGRGGGGGTEAAAGAPAASCSDCTRLLCGYQLTAAVQEADREQKALLAGQAVELERLQQQMAAHDAEVGSEAGARRAQVAEIARLQQQVNQMARHEAADAAGHHDDEEAWEQWKAEDSAADAARESELAALRRDMGLVKARAAVGALLRRYRRCCRHPAAIAACSVL